MRGSRWLVLAALLMALAPAAHAATPARDTVLTILGDVERPYALSAAEFAALPHVNVVATGHDSVTSTWAGVSLQALLSGAGLKFGADLRGARMATAVVVEASDGYRAVFAIAELDSGFAKRTVLLADRRDGKPNTEADGRLRIVVPGERPFARWVRQVVTLRVKKL